MQHFRLCKKLRIADRLKLGHVTLHKTHLPAGGRVARGPHGWCGERACGVCGFGGFRVKLVGFFGVRGARGLVEFVGLLRCARRTEPVTPRDCPWRRYGTLF